MGTETSVCNTSAPSFLGDREDLTMQEREDGLYKALQWVKDELKGLKSLDQSLMRQFSSLRSKINTLRDELPTSIDRSSTISIFSPKPSDDEDVFFANSDSRMRFNSDTSFRTKSYSSNSEEEKL